MPLPMTMKDIERLTAGMSAAGVESLNVRVQRSNNAAARLRQLAASPDFVAKYQRNDPDSVDAYNLLIKAKVDGMDALQSLQSPDVNTTASAKQAHEQAVASMVNDPEFVNRYMRGDAKAVAQWREVSVDGTAAMLGIDPNASLVGQGAPAAQPAPSAVGTATTGGAPS